MHSNRRYRIFNCSVILGELESFRKKKDFGIIFRKNFRCNLSYYSARVFLIPLSSHFWIRKCEVSILVRTNSLTWAMKWEKSIFGARESCMNGTVGFIGYFSHRKFLAIFASPCRYFTQSSQWVPLALFIGFVCSGVIVCLFFWSLPLLSVLLTGLPSLC